MTAGPSPEPGIRVPYVWLGWNLRNGHPTVNLLGQRPDRPYASRPSELERFAEVPGVTRVADTSNIGRLDSLDDPFNIFEALGEARRELRHSNFLAFLLDPRRNHGLGTSCARRFFGRVAAIGTSGSGIMDPVSWDLSEIELRREWKNIDILILDHRRRIAVIIENKIFSTEHSDQLARYRTSVSSAFPNWQLVCLYLTPDSSPPSDLAYIPIAYRLICEVAEEILGHHDGLAPEFAVLLTHYAAMLRRHVVPTYEERDRQAVQALLEVLVRERAPALLLVHSTISRIGFVLPEWRVPVLQTGTSWGNSKDVLRFQFVNEPQRFVLKLTLGECEPIAHARIESLVRRMQPPFTGPFQHPTGKWHHIFVQPLPVGTTPDVFEQELRRVWLRFLQEKLPLLRMAIAGELGL